jgi:hypothetical protein
MRNALLIVVAIGCSAVSARAWPPELEAHLKAQRTGICELHHVPMKRVVVDATYGMPAYDKAYVAAQGRYFPNGETETNRGCVVPARLEKLAIYVCPKCKRARKEWALKHPTNWQAKLVLQEK